MLQYNTQTPVSLTWKTGNTPTGHHTFITLTLGNTNDVNHLILLENSINWGLFLKNSVSKINLLGNCSTVNLDLRKVVLLLLQTCVQ